VPDATEVVAVNAGETVDLAAAVEVLRGRGCAVIVSEGGPTLFGELLASDLVDELFLTVAPVLAGRGPTKRLGLVEGVELLPDTRIAGRLRSARTHGSHLFLRSGLRLVPRCLQRRSIPFGIASSRSVITRSLYSRKCSGST